MSVVETLSSHHVQVSVLKIYTLGAAVALPAGSAAIVSNGLGHEVGAPDHRCNLSSVIGRSRTRLTPSGLMISSGSSTKMTLMSYTSAFTGTWYSAMLAFMIRPNL